MQALIAQIRARLQRRAYANEAAISHGVVMPILAALGWDTADPRQVVPEFALPGGRVDFALFGLGRQPAVFVEVKQVGRAMTGDEQLFDYSYRHGVPLCVLTDGLEWSFYLPGGQGTYDERRVYRLQLDDRDAATSEERLTRYLSRSRVRDGVAFDDAHRDHRDALRRREAAEALPRAWRELTAEANDQLLEALTEKSEALSGYTPVPDEVIAFLRLLEPTSPTMAASTVTKAASAKSASPPIIQNGDRAKLSRTVTYVMHGERRTAPDASVALVDILSAIVARDPSLIPELARAVSGTKVNHIGRTPEEINPAKPHLARAKEISPGWSVGLNIANRTKAGIIRTACELYKLRMPDDLDVRLPNS